MEHLVSVDWHSFFVPHNSVLEMVVRGTFMYLAIFALLRILGRRQSGSLGAADLLVIVLLADAAQNGMAGEYHSVTEGLALICTILAWDFVIDWLRYHYPALRPLLESPALPLVKNGVMLRRNMRHEMITADELLSQLRQQGVDSVDMVKLAQLEEDGHVSVIRRDDASPA